MGASRVLGVVAASQFGLMAPLLAPPPPLCLRAGWLSFIVSSLLRNMVYRNGEIHIEESENTDKKIVDAVGSSIHALFLGADWLSF